MEIEPEKKESCLNDDVLLMMTGMNYYDYCKHQWKNFVPIHKEAIKASNYLIAWTPELDIGILLGGSPGCGKTFMMKCFIFHWFDSGRYFYYTTPIDIFTKLKNSFSNECAEDVYDNFINPYGLVIDNLGEEKGSEWEIETLFYIIERRNNLGHPTFFATSYSNEHLREKYTDKHFSRLLSHVGVVICKGPSYSAIVEKENNDALNEAVSLAHKMTDKKMRSV